MPPQDSIPPAPVARRYPGRLFLALGLGLMVLGMVGYGVQIWMGQLTTPWYMPSLATLGVVCVIVALRQTRTIWHVLILVLVVLITGAEWAFLLGTRLPAYTGPVAVGKPFPAFKTTREEGTPFTERDLSGPENSVLVFFRGRW